MITPDRIEAWRRTGAVAGTHGSPSGNALLDACDEIQRLQAYQENMRRSCAAEDERKDVWTKTFINDLVTAEADRDRARDAAVAMEQQIAAARAIHEAEQYIDDAWPTCLECTKDNADVVPWPCPTVRALDGGEAP